MLAAGDRLTVERLKERLLGQGVGVRQTVVFGSRAHGDADAEPDLDVLVLVDELDYPARQRIRECAWEVGFDAGVVVSPVAMACREAEESPGRASLFLQLVRAEGVAV